jgi:hypothetical protein
MADPIRLKTTHIEQQDPDRVTMSYNREIDTLFIRLDAFGGLHVACYLDDGVYALFDPETMEVVGFQVENWEKAFLNIHPDLKQFWPTSPEPQEEMGYIVDIVKRYTPSECYT